MKETNSHIVQNFGDVIYSCLIPNNLQWEHRMPNHGLIFVRSGRFVIEDHSKITEVDAGGCVFLRRDCSVKVTKMPVSNEPYRGINISLPRKFLKDYFTEFSSTGHLPGNVKPLTDVATVLPQTTISDSLFQSLLPYIDRNETPLPEILKLKLQETLVLLLNTDQRFFPTLFDFNEKWRINLREFMEKHYTENLSLEEFASYTGRSLATFKRDFADISDLSPQRWIKEHRLELAHKMLREGSVSTTEVATKVGFKNRSHFSTVFKNKYGVTPVSLIK